MLCFTTKLSTPPTRFYHDQGPASKSGPPTGPVVHIAVPFQGSFLTHSNLVPMNFRRVPATQENLRKSAECVNCVPLPPRKFNSSPLKNDGWKTSLSYWDSVTFQGRAVKLREGMAYILEVFVPFLGWGFMAPNTGCCNWLREKNPDRRWPPCFGGRE